MTTVRRRRFAAGLVTSLAVVVASFATAPGVGAASPGVASITGAGGGTVPAGAAGAAGALGQAVEITLITGDKVRYESGPAGQQQVTVVEAVSVDFRGEEPPDGGVYLFPDLAEPYVASGVLDRELFNIEYLATQGYDDASMDRLPLIVDYADTGAGAAAVSRASVDAAELAGSRTDLVLESIGAAGVSVDKTHADRFWQSLTPQAAAPETAAPGTFAVPSAVGDRGAVAAGGLSTVDRVWLDRRVSVTLDESVGLIGAPEAWDAGLDGTGVTVAVLDTGIDATHPDFAGKVVASESFVSDTTEDGHGHGTHVASTLLGSGTASDGQYRGVAPGADLVVGKVLNDEGEGSWAEVIAGMEWAAQEQDADIVSMSLGAAVPGLDGTDPVSQAVNNLTASTGALFVVAAGNSGCNSGCQGTVETPGVADAALTVAASQVDLVNPIANFSSRGPRVDGVLKPDIAAPGVGIVAARAAGTSMGGPVNDHYTSANGTSMATPHVAGAAAILAQQHPDWTPERLKTTLMSTSLGLTSLFGNLPPPRVYAQGAGRVDVARAVSQQLRTDTASISPGILELDEPPRSVPVTYLNDSADELTVTVEATLRGPDEQPAADGVLSLDQDTLTLPPGGSATVTVTIDVTAATAFGLHDGVITAATGAGDSLRTPIGVTIQPPLHDLTVRVATLEPFGDNFNMGLRNWEALRVDDQEVPWDAPVVWQIADFGDQVVVGTARVPDGSYFVHGVFDWPGQLRNSGWAVEEVTVDGDTVVTIDMRDLVPVTVTADQPTEQVWRVSSQGLTTEAGVIHSFWRLSGIPEGYQDWRYPTQPVTHGELWMREGFILAEPELLLDLRGGGPRLTLHPAYPDYPANSEDTLAKFTQDARTVLVTEADLDAGRDVHGALVHVNLPGDTEPEQCPAHNNPTHWCAVVNHVQQAAEAGAAGVLLTTPGVSLQALALGVELTPSSLLPVPFAWLDEAQADQLAGRLGSGKPAKVWMDANLEPAYEYKLWFDESGQVPADLDYKLSSRDLKRVDTTYHGTESTTPECSDAGETMAPFWPGQNLSFSTVRYFDAPTQRVEYYLPTGPEVVHVLDIFWLDHNCEKSSRSGTLTRTLVGTESETLGWGTVATPGQMRVEGVPDEFAWSRCAVCRQGDRLWVLPRPTTGDGSQSWGGYDASVRLFQADGAEVSGVAPGQFPLPAESGRYRLEHVQTDTTTDTLYNREVRTEWEFTATAKPTVNEVEFPYGKPDFFGPAPAAWQPVIFLNYDIPLELDNTARAGRPIMFTVHAAAGQPGSGADIQGLELEASFDDGATWTDARVIRALGDGAFWVMLKHPKLSQTTGAVSLRAHAWDSAGNQVTQTVDRAYGLTGNPGPRR